MGVTLLGRNLVSGLLLAAALCAGGETTVHSSRTGVAQQTSVQATRRLVFKSPPSEYRPFIRWWWPGGDVEDSELTREIKAMSSAGFAGAEIQSFAVGLPKDASDRVFTHGSDEWFKHLGTVLEEAKRSGFTIDLTLGSSWPPGGAHIDSAHGLKQLVYTAELVKGPGQYRKFPPEVSKPLGYQLASDIMQIADTFRAEEMKRFGVMAIRIDSNQGPRLLQPAPSAGLQPLPQTIYLDRDSVVDLNDRIGSQGVLEWEIPSGEWALLTFYEGPTRSQPFYAAEPGGGYVLDHLDRSAVDLHLRTIGDAAKARFGSHFGQTLRALFVDSFELRTELYWSSSFLAEFEKRRGYSLLPFLPVLFRPFHCDTYLRKLFLGASPYFEYRDAGSRVREDYDQTVAELMLENFVTPVAEWGKANQLQLRLQAHGAPLNILSAYRRASIPETEGLYAGGRRGFLRAAASAGHQSGSRRVSSEVLAFPNGDYASSPSRVVAECNRQLAAGVNQLVMHGFPYVYNKSFPEPGWMPFSSPYMPGIAAIGTFGEHLNDRNPLWQWIPNLNLYLTRAQYLLSSGDVQADIAIYSDGFGFPDSADPDPQLNQSLDANGYAYEYVDDEALLQADLRGGTLTIGSAVYRALVLPDVSRISDRMAVRLVELIGAGIPVIFSGNIPSRTIGYLDYRQRDRNVEAQMESIFGSSLASVRSSGFFRNRSAVFHADVAAVPNLLRDELKIRPSVQLGDARDSLRFTHRRVDGIDLYFIASLREVKTSASIQFPDDGRLPELWNLWTGEVSVAPRYSRSRGMVKVDVEFEPGGAVLIGFGDAPSPGPAIAASNLTSVVRSEGGKLIAWTRNPGAYSIVYENGRRVTARVSEGAQKLDPLHLSDWRLRAAGVGIDGAEKTVYFPQFRLVDWREVPALSGFAGTGTYTIDLYVDPVYIQPNIALELDLGDVHDVADVKVNGAAVATLIAGPYRADVSKHVRSGLNQIEIRVSTALRNRYAGFGLNGVGYFSRFLSRTPPQIPTGLIGPVRIVPQYQVELSDSGPEAQQMPIPLALNIVPAFIPPPREQNVDFVGALQRARELTSSVSFSFFWRDPLTDVVTTADDVAPLVVTARQYGLEVIVQLLPFFVGDLAVPRDFGQSSFTNPELQRAFLDQAVKLAKLQPDYLVLGTEINFGRDMNPREYIAYLPVYKRAYDLVKLISPNTQVGTNYQYDYLKKGGAANNKIPDWSAVKDIGDKQDFIGLNTYFGGTLVDYTLFPTAGDVPDDYYDEIRRALGPDKRVVMTEFAWTSFYGEGKQNQSDFIKRVPDLMRRVDAGLIIWPLQHDIRYYTGFLEGLNYAGLLEWTGAAKPGWNTIISMTQEGLFGPRSLFVEGSGNAPAK